MDKRDIDKLWPNIHWLTVLAQQGSFTAAAKRLNVSKAAMSNRMVELEKAAGMQLIKRTTRSVHLTEAGQHLVELTSHSFSHIADSFNDIKNLAEVPSGLIRMTAPVAFSRQHLISTLPPFLKKYPQVRLELDLNDRLVSLASEGFDIAIRHIDTPPDIYVSRKICSTRTVLVASPNLISKPNTPKHPRDLSKYRHLIYPRQRRFNNWIFEHRNKKGDITNVSLPLHSPLIANNSEVLRDMACEGAGVALLPDFSAKQAIESGQLIEILPQWRSVGSFGRSIFVLRPYTPNTPRAVSLLFEQIRNSFIDGFVIPRK